MTTSTRHGGVSLPVERDWADIPDAETPRKDEVAAEIAALIAAETAALLPTSDQKDALDAATTPSASNPIATIADLTEYDYDSGFIAVATADASKLFNHALDHTDPFTSVRVQMRDANNVIIDVDIALGGGAISGVGSEAYGFSGEPTDANNYTLYRAVNSSYNGTNNIHSWRPGNGVTRVAAPNGWAGTQPTHIRLLLKK